MNKVEVSKLTFCSDTTVAGHYIKKSHIVEAVGGELLVHRGNAVHQLLADVGQVTLS